MSRRSFVVAGAVAGLAACTGQRGSSGPGSTLLPGVGGAPFTSPDEVRSVGGRLELELVAAAGTIDWDGGRRFATTYNGTAPGPTWRVRPGDTVVVTLRNELDEPTNLHTHGLHVSPDGDSDNILVMVGPGESHTYTYEIPTDHPSGTFWYHPHHHGLVAPQLSGGMAGVIVVEDELDDLPAMRVTAERVMVLGDPAIGTDAGVLDVSQMQMMQGREGDVVLVNGQAMPRLDAAVGVVERWRLVNASASRYYRLSVGAPMHVLGSDHGRIGAPQQIDDVLLTPGQRVEVLVPFATAGRYVLRTAAVDRGGMGAGMGGGMGGMGGGMGGGSVSGAAELLVVDVADAGTAPASPALPAALRPLDPVDALTVDRARTVRLGGMGMGMGGFTIDGRSFEMDRVDIEVDIDTIEEWTIVNDSMMDHPFHLHVWPMRVVGAVAAADQGWRDTVNVPAGGSLTVRIPFHDFTGTAVYHCHILDHEDMGMMGVIRVS